MARKLSIQLTMLIFIASFALVAYGCAKKEMVREETAGKPAMEARTEPLAPEVMQEPKEEASEPAAMAPAEPEEQTLPKEAAQPAEKSFDLAAYRLRFAFDDYNLSRRSERKLDKIAEWLKENPDTKIQIQGYTCDIGTDEYNLALGDERAESAEKYLETQGIESSRLSRISYGKERPRVANSDEKHRSMNRRDEFVMLK